MCRSVVALLLGAWMVVTALEARAQDCEFLSLYNQLPQGGALVSPTPTLEVGAFETKQTPCPHHYTQWQIATDRDFEFLALDSQMDPENLYAFTVPEGYLQPGQGYYWRARAFSPGQELAFWSDPTGFTVAQEGPGPEEEEAPVEVFAPGAPFEVRQGPILFPGRREPVVVSFAVVNGMAVFEGDILLGQVGGFNSAQPQAAQHPSPQGSGIRSLAGNLWPGGRVAYVIHASLGPAKAAEIQQAIQHWEANTSIRFVGRTTEADYVEFTSGGGCASYVSRIGGRQDIVLAAGCDVGAIIHEIGHAVGLFHEQSRCDRDSFVHILFHNIVPGMEHNFNNECAAGFDIGAYDFGSIMHYPSRAFSATGAPTIETIPPGIPIGNRSGLSAGDIAAVQALYGAPPPLPPGGNNNPTVTLGFAPLGPAPGQRIDLAANAQDPDGDPLTYEWFLDGVRQLVTGSTVVWPSPTEGTHTVTVRVADGLGGAAEDTVSITVSAGGPPVPPAGLSLEDALDGNDNGLLDDDEIQRAIEYWIRGEEVPGTGQTISDDKIVALLRKWILGERLFP